MFCKIRGHTLTSGVVPEEFAECLKRPDFSHARPESAKTGSSPWDVPCPKQGRSSAADPRFTFHASRFTVSWSEARTPPGEKRVSARRGRVGEMAGFFSILLQATTQRDA